MSDLPDHWQNTTVGEIATVQLGKMLDKANNKGEPTPYLRNINVRWGSCDLTDVATMDIRPEELDRVLARTDDVIACEGGEPGRAGIPDVDLVVARVPDRQGSSESEGAGLLQKSCR